MSHDIKVKTEKFDGREIDLCVDDEGTFYAVWEGDQYTASTFDVLRKKLTAVVRRKKARIAIPIVVLESRYHHRLNEEVIAARTTVLTGIHQRNRNVLYQGADGKTTQTDYHVEFYAAQTDVTEFNRLLKVVDDATAALARFKDAHKVNAREVIIAAVKQAGHGTEDLEE